MPGSAYVCCLCGADEFGYGNNPAPLDQMPNRCCDVCNYTKVIPARLEMMFAEGREFSSEDNQDLAAAAIIGGIFTVSMGALLEQLAKALNDKDAAAATFFKDCIDYMAMTMVSSYEENTKDFPKEVKYAIEMTLGMTAKQFAEWEEDPAFEELTNLGASENPDVDTMSEVVLDEAIDFKDDFGVMYSADEVFKCSCGGTLIIGEPIRSIECDTCGGTDYQAESYVPLGEDHWDLYWLDSGPGPVMDEAAIPNVKIADRISKKLNKELEKAFNKVDRGADPQTEAIKVWHHMEDFMDKYGDEGATDTEPQELMVMWINDAFHDAGHKNVYFHRHDDDVFRWNAESYADFFTQMEKLLESTTIAGGWTLDATTDQEDPDAVTMVVKFKPSDPSTFFDIIE